MKTRMTKQPIAIGREMASKFRGTCAHCGQVIEVGERITWFGKGRTYHLTCVPQPVVTTVLSRQDALLVTCPFCLAEPGHPCMGIRRRNGTRKEREGPHSERYAAAQEDVV